MQATQKRYIAFIAALVVPSFLLFQFHDTIPLSIAQHRDDAPAVATVPIRTNNDVHQPGYFKYQPEWNWEAPADESWRGNARKLQNDEIVVLTASDGLGHNSAVPNILERVLGDREKYCAKHGYTNLWLNTSRYDIGEAHRTWSKIPAVAEAFYLLPKAKWVWLVDTDIIIMSPSTSLASDILSPSAIKHGIMRDTPILDGMLDENPTHINTPREYRVQDIDILATQDHQSVNSGSIFFRRSTFTRMLLEMMTDHTMLMGQERLGAEQDALKHLMLEHELVRKHVGIYPQRKFNAYVQGGPNMGYRDGDLAVHLAGCWVTNSCKDWFEEFWGKRGHTDVWKPDEAR
ncbi:Glyco-transf-34 domain containing protein [Pyrenophora tritici-repentis]|uniref:Glyco-transf-34 domain containing protein n=1 Tax=Pyrenophora tritici-repentis TaxID=45151 RepID=A0A2W1E6B3_9PLEO|nr:Glyco-transf-34 domain-containing protein [Pyrenophora tritici-repentis]KAF7444473.1 Glyco-transf-34 domain containing protein [Pyrenophora tritici-repentis]KAF7564875.1 Glyco-transf-34 domain containing protein [Pyrenophora tritici-repentis]KAG9378714.1 Glyco-transf-34 domain containing protein [Pyrenophora tritici-repentis]KAI1537988.1 Glyco-transf-34 domain containing protein [Pyrenophora tritici-repentis]